MRKIIPFLCALVLISNAGKAQYVNLPDTNFRNILRSSYPGCFNSSGQMDTTCSEILNKESLQFDSYYNHIINFEGLQYFKRLKHFDCRNIDTNDIFPSFPDSLITFICQSMYGSPRLPLLPASLQYFDCSFSYNLDTLPTLPPGLKRLDCSNCSRLTAISNLPASLEYLNMDRCSPVTILPPLPSTLDTLSCMECFITTLPTLPGNITYINCSRNPITTLPALPNSITYLDCGNFIRRFFEDTSRLEMPALPLSLKYFNCQTSGMRSMQPLPPTLEKLICSGTPISSSITFPSTLKWLECAGCGMHVFPSLPRTMTYLDCSNNPFGFIPAFPDSLTLLRCAADSLAVLPTLPSSINSIECGSNQLVNLPGLPTGLEELVCNDNLIVSLPVLPSTLTKLWCGNNKLSSLPALPDTLISLECQLNLLPSLPSLPSRLYTLNCRRNQLNFLPDLPRTLSQLDCRDNNIYCLPKMPQFESPLIVDCDWKINCIPNTSANIYIQRYDTLTGIPVPGLPLCNPTNNIYQCEAFPIIQGAVFYDRNSNGIQDAGEPVKSNVRVNLSNNAFTFSNISGQYEIGADSIGNFTLGAVAPKYYRLAPASHNFNFINYDTLIANQNFVLQIDSIVDELSIKITSINWAARPGFSFPYLISYENTGTTTLSPNIVFDYDQAKLNYNTSSVSGVTDNANMLVYNAGSLLPGQSGSFIGYFTLKTTVPIGDTLNSKAIISANSFTAYDSVQTGVRGSYDPNDKEATPQLSPSQVANGKYIDYTIRFQNTGTDTAFNIVVSDTLNENLQAESLQMLVSSHNCKATVKDNIVFFEFLNILLPDSNINEPKSHGFVSFRIKPQTIVLPNTTIPNKAAIYFDYNVPVMTNIASTVIKDFTVVPLKLISFSAVPQNDNTVSLNWNTANEINIKYFTIEKSPDALRFNSVTNVAAEGKATNDYYASVRDENSGITFYRLKIVDNDGRFSYSPIIKIDRRKDAAGFSVLTNPVKDFIIINTTDKILNNTQGSLVNTNGAVVKNFNIKQGSQTVEIKGMPAGIYYLKTINGSSKIIIL